VSNSSNTIAIIDYGMGNLGSVANACSFLKLPAKIITSPDELDDVAGVILPGQGAFGDCMGNLAAAGFVDPLKDWMAADKPLLGICIGLQVLFEGSAESPGTKGLGVLPGVLDKFVPHPDRKVPQMGWNSMQQKANLQGKPCPLWDGIDDDAYFYFVHSFYAPLPPEATTADTDWVSGTTTFGHEYTSAIWRGRLFATQFHPEKSQSAGKRLLKNFAATIDG